VAEQPAETPASTEEDTEAATPATATTAKPPSQLIHGPHDTCDEEDKQDPEYAHTFEDMKLKEPLLRGIFGYGFEKPSVIQSKAIIPISKGRDIIAQSQSGTGKTATFVTSLLQRCDPNIRGCQAIVIVPTRELAAQIKDVCLKIGQYCRITPVLCIGGINVYDAKRELESGASVVIGTPGRITDMMQRRFLSTRSIKMMILDEADDMLKPGFASSIRTVVDQLPEQAQVCLFSATMTPDVTEFGNKMMRDPKIILVKQEHITLEGIKQFYIDVGNDRYKLDTFCDIFEMISVSQTMVYVNTKRRADELKDILSQRNFTVSVMHGQMEQPERTAIMKQFRSGETRILISTDLLARGIDIQQVSIVINYEIPNDKECYIHRIGRSGRFGRKGVAINLVTNRDFYKLKDLERYYSTTIEPMPQHIADLI
jgi:translation initiation factor 4A